MDQTIQKRLSGLLGENVSFDRVERKLYSHDVGSIPKLIKPFMAAGLAGAVVRPGNEEELLELVRLAVATGTALVPRGAGTSGYGGSMPEEGAVVVDMRRFDRIVTVDTEAQTVTVEAGVLWQDLERALAAQGLALRLYPTSAPSSTVAGWLAQGGSGYGSYEYGWFRDNVVSVRVVRPDAAIEHVVGDSLDLIADAEGMTGFIVQVTLKVQPLEELELLAATFDSPETLQAAMDEARASQLRLWSVSFLNPAAVRLGKKLPAKTHHGHPIHVTHTPLEVPESFVALIAWRAGDDGIRAGLEALVERSGGAVLPDEVARHEWELRYSPMRVKRIGPSLIPTEVVVPRDSLAAVLRDIDARVDLPLVIEGVGVKGDEFVLLGFIPHDERRFGYNVAFGLALSVIKVARAHGGRAYSTGIYFKRYADEILGAERVRRLQAHKDSVDAAGITQPGQGLRQRDVDHPHGCRRDRSSPWCGRWATPSPPSSASGSTAGRTAFRMKWPATPTPAPSAATASTGAPSSAGAGGSRHSPRGKWFYLREVLEGREELTQEWVDKFLVCTTCEKCNTVCPLDLPIEAVLGTAAR